MAFGGDGEDLPGLLQRSRVTELDVAHECLHRRQPGVAGGRPDASMPLDVAQKGHDEWGVELFEVQPGRPDAVTFGGEGEQQPKRVSVALAGMRAEAALVVSRIESSRERVNWSE